MRFDRTSLFLNFLLIFSKSRLYASVVFRIAVIIFTHRHNLILA